MTARKGWISGRIGPGGLRRFVLLGLFLAAFAACDSSTVPGSDSPVGVFTLILVNGEEVPYLLLDTPEQSFEITSGSFTLEEDGSCLLVIVETETVEGDSLETTTQAECTWQTVDTTLFIINESGQTQTVNWVGNRIIMPVGQLGFVFER